MPSAWGVLAVKANAKDAMRCAELVFKGAAAAVPDSAASDNEPGSAVPAPPAKKARATPGSIPGEGSSRTGHIPKNARLQEERLMTKRVPLGSDATCFVTIGASLPDK